MRLFLDNYMEKRILIVDDEPIIREMLQEVFQGAGYEVTTAETAEKAISILQEQSILVMYLDLKLPGMSGVELCEHIRIQNPLAIIHAITGYTDFFGLLECRKAGFEDFFQKPVDIHVLLDSVRRAFQKLERWRVDEYNLL